MSRLTSSGSIFGEQSCQDFPVSILYGAEIPYSKSVPFDCLQQLLRLQNICMIIQNESSCGMQQESATTYFKVYYKATFLDILTKITKGQSKQPVCDSHSNRKHSVSVTPNDVPICPIFPCIYCPQNEFEVPDRTSTRGTKQIYFKHFSRNLKLPMYLII